MNIPSIKFVFDRKHKADANTRGCVDLRITYNYKQKFISTKVTCYPGQWDNKRECINNKCIEAESLNAILLQMRTNVLNIITTMAANGNVDINAIQSRLKSHSVDMTFEQYIYKRMHEKPVSDNTKKAYHVFYSRFSAWGKMECFEDISERNIRAWDEYLHNFTWKENDRYGKEIVCRYSQATIGSMHKNLKAFINDAIVDGYIKENPYTTKRIKIDKGTTRIDSFLTKEEVCKLENTQMPTKSLEEAKDLFLMQIYTGLSYVDLMAYDFTKCKDANDFAVFSGIRSKTGVVFVFVITPKAKEILNKYSFSLPVIPNQKYNVKLKLVADAAAIDKNICSHDGRRTCGYILLNSGVPWSVVTRILGHSSVKQTEKAYARLLDETIADEIKKHI